MHTAHRLYSLSLDGNAVVNAKENTKETLQVGLLSSNFAEEIHDSGEHNQQNATSRT